MLTHNIEADKSFFCSEAVSLLFAVVGFNHRESPSQFENRIMARGGGGGGGVRSITRIGHGIYLVLLPSGGLADYDFHIAQCFTSF